MKERIPSFKTYQVGVPKWWVERQWRKAIIANMLLDIFQNNKWQFTDRGNAMLLFKPYKIVGQMV